MNLLFADPYYFLALLHRGDAAHSKAVALAEKLTNPVVTTAWVLTEVGDALSSLHRIYILLARSRRQVATLEGMGSSDRVREKTVGGRGGEMEERIGVKVRRGRPGRSLASTLAGMLCLAGLPLWAGQQPQARPIAGVQQTADDPAQRAAPAPAYRPVPGALSLRAGTVVTVRVSQFLSSDQNRPGDLFSAELQQPLVVNGWVVARRGQTVLGRVAVAQKAGRVKGTSQLGLELTQLVLVDGQQLPVQTQLVESSGGTSRGRDAQAIGTGAGIGAAIGAAANGGQGAGVGAAIGAGAGLAGVLLTRGRPTVIPPETALTFQLQSPVTFSTAGSAAAFRPVIPEDYKGGRLERRTDHFATRPYGRPPVYYYSAYGPWYYPGAFYYPAPYFVGFYGYRSHFGHRRFRY